MIKYNFYRLKKGVIYTLLYPNTEKRIISSEVVFSGYYLE